MSAPRNPSTDTVVVGRIGRPHGVRGEVTVEVRNKAGAIIDTCKMGKRVTWAADRLGVEPEIEG